jgi:hypothetical protein
VNFSGFSSIFRDTADVQADARGHPGAQDLRVERGPKIAVILLVHRQDTMRLLGFSIGRYIDIND